MKLVLLVTGGRGGSDFFQGLLDGHDEILQFPGVLRANNELFKILELDNYSEVANKFTKYVPHFFDSRKNNIERHDRLGRNRDQFYVVDKKKFTNKLLTLTKSLKKISKLELLLKIHQAYYLARNKEINNYKLLFIHTHTILLTKNFIKIINPNNFSIIHTMRFPMNALNSPIKNWLKYKKGQFFFPKDLYFQYDLAINGISDLLKITNKTYLVLLENLLFNRKLVMKNFCKIYKISYSEILLQCTYFNKQWWGDKISNKWIGKSYVKNNHFFELDKNLFFKRDLVYFYSLFENIINKYYKELFINYNEKIYFNIFPTKSELVVWKNTINHMKLKHILSIPYFYFKRVILLSNSFIKKNKLPYSIGIKNI